MKVAVNIADLERQARSRLPRVVYDYLAGGAEDERTLKENREAFGRWHLRARVLRGYGAPDLSTTLFGQKMGLPILIGPTGLNGLHWRGADVALARAAASLDAVFALSTASNESLEAVARSTPGPKWYQLYPWGDRSVCQRLRNHGLLTCGETVSHALTLMRYLMGACETQLMLQATGCEITIPPDDVCEHAARQWEHHDAHGGKDDWPAYLRIADRLDPSYRT